MGWHVMGHRLLELFSSSVSTVHGEGCWAVSELPGDQGQSEAPRLCKGVWYKHLTFAEAGILASTAGLLLGQWVHTKEAIMPVGRGGRTGNSSCSASAKFYNSLDKCKKKKAFYLCSQGSRIQFFQHYWVDLRCGTPKLMKSRKLLHFLKTTLSTLG